MCQGRPTAAIIDQIRAVTKERFRNKIENISAQHLRLIEGALRNILEL
jgi:mRNA-degrading endonuclease toxin of MazEF toxin-antitoxin module